MKELPTFQMKTLDGRFIVLHQEVDRFQHPVIIVDVFSVNMERQATFKLGFKDIPNLRMALQAYSEAMLESMCDY